MANAVVKPAYKVIVFGASGFIGANIFGHLKQKKDFDIVGYSSKNCNLLDQPQTAEVLASSNSKTTAILCSAISRSVEDSWDAMLKNITMVNNFVSSIPSSGLRSIIFLSSADIYGNALSKTLIDEGMVPEPKGFYALSKLTCEYIFRISGRCSYPVTCLRLPGIYGYGDGYKSVIGKFIKNLLDCKQIKIMGDGMAKRDYVEVGDLCRVVEHFVRQPYNGPINVATGKSVSIKDIAMIISDVVGVKASFKWLDDRNSARVDLMFDTKRLKSLCPTIRFKNLKNGVKHYIEQ